MDRAFVVMAAFKAGGEALVKLKMGRTWRQVRHPLRQAVERRHDAYGHMYRRRAAIEALFSQVKRKMGSGVRVRSERLAMVLMLARFACWNISLLVGVLQGQESFLLFCCLVIWTY